MEATIKEGDKIKYNGHDAVVTVVGLAGEYGPRVEIKVGHATILTTPGLDRAWGKATKQGDEK